MKTQEYRLVPISVMARLVHVSPQWLRAEARAGRIPALCAGDRLVFRPEIVIAVIAKRAAQYRKLEGVTR